MSEIIVSKFGGSSLASKEDVEKIKKIIEENPNRKVIVISAPGKKADEEKKVTDMLIDLAISKDADLIEKIAERYDSIYNGEKKEVMQRLTERFKQNLSGEAFLDSLKAFGEEENARLLAKFLDAEFIDTREIIKMNGKFGKAGVDLESSCENIKKLNTEGQILVIPGFYGLNKDGFVMTFSRGGSDLTAAIIARALNAETYEKFTDSPIFAANPDVINNPKIIEEMTYTELRDLSYSGFGIFHSKAMLPLQNNSKVIPIHVRSFKNYPEKGTWIVGERVANPEKPIVGVAYKGDFCAFDIEKLGLNDMHGIIYKLAKVFFESGIPIEFLNGSVDDVSFIVHQIPLLKKDAVDFVREELKKLAGNNSSIRFRQNLGCLIVAGKGLKYEKTMQLEILKILNENGIEVYYNSLGSNKRSFIYSIAMKEGDKAVKAIYDKFIK